MPDAWSDLIKALTLLARGQCKDISPCHCEHDVLTVMADPAQFTPEELEQLNGWGFLPDHSDMVFSLFRFGSA